MRGSCRRRGRGHIWLLVDVCSTHQQRASSPSNLPSTTQFPLSSDVRLLSPAFSLISHLLSSIWYPILFILLAIFCDLFPPTSYYHTPSSTNPSSLASLSPVPPFAWHISVVLVPLVSPFSSESAIFSAYLPILVEKADLRPNRDSWSLNSSLLIPPLPPHHPLLK